MPKFILEINLGNDAMKTNFNVGSKLMGIGNQITYGKPRQMIPEGKTTIRDFNGNSVGFYQVIDDPCGDIKCDECNVGGCPHGEKVE